MMGVWDCLSLFRAYEICIKSESLSTVSYTPLGSEHTVSLCPLSFLGNDVFSALYFYVYFIYVWQISRNGRILSEKEYKLNIMSQDHQKYIQECLAQAIFHKVLDMEVQVFTMFFIIDIF